MKQYLFLFLSIVFLSSCSSSEPTFTPETESDIIKYIQDNNLNAAKTESGLYYVIDKEGTGDQPNNDSDVIISYKGILLNGTTFTQTDTDGIAVPLISQIQGLAEGLQLFKEGGEGTLLIPSELGFGDGVVLIMEVKLIDVIDNEADILTYIDQNNLNATRTDSGLYYVIHDEGVGIKPISSSSVTVAYKGYFLDGTVFDESNDSGITFRLNQVIAGWTEGIPLFREGGEGILLIPSNLAYGLQERSSIPGGSVLIFDIKLISVN
jgi:FKBP-type peptidyl-prolyl cis-trans isomerase